MNLLKLFICFVSFGCLLNNTQCLAQKDWKLYKKKEHYTIWLKNIPNTKLKQFKLEATLKENINTLYKIMKDVEQMHLWYDKVKSVKILKKLNENAGIYLLEYDLPFPFEDRITTIKGTMDYSKDSGKIIVHTNYFEHPVPKDKLEMLKITKLAGSWEISTLPDGCVNVIHSGYLDPEGNIPDWLVNEGVTSGPLKTLDGLKRRLIAYK